MADFISPENCQDMKTLREQIDLLDSEIVGLLSQRVAYIKRAAEIKSTTEIMPARINWRVDEVINNARENARKHGLDPELAEMIWRNLVEWSIALEEKKMDKD